jgi:hypothetical protein
MNDKERRMFAALPASQIIASRDGETSLAISGHELALASLLA